MTTRRKPTRRDLLVVIQRLQHAIGSAIGSYMDDRSPSRADNVLGALRPAFDLAIEAQDHDQSVTQTGPWSNP